VALVETVAHTESAMKFYDDPQVIVDVGGQDIKLIVLKNGRFKGSAAIFDVVLGSTAQRDQSFIGAYPAFRRRPSEIRYAGAGIPLRHVAGPKHAAVAG
jgi:hypothetical protein